MGILRSNPFLLRRDWSSVELPRLDHYGRNLAETLYRLDAEARQRVLQATRAVIGLPDDIEPRLAEEEGRFYFVQQEAGHRYRVHQIGVSSGTLRMLALMTALHTSPEPKLIGIEEPENYLHPTALSSFVEYLCDVGENIQLVITTHSPLVLDVLCDPGVVRVVRRDGERGTVVEAGDSEGVRRALEASGSKRSEQRLSTPRSQERPKRRIQRGENPLMAAGWTRQYLQVAIGELHQVPAAVSRP